MGVRFIGFVYRLPSISWEEFDRLWSNHGILVANAPGFKDGKVKYTQHHKDTSIVPALSALAAVSDCDGIAEFEAESMDDLKAVFTNEEFAKIIRPDEARFLERSKSVLLPLGKIETAAELAKKTAA